MLKRSLEHWGNYGGVLFHQRLTQVLAVI